MNTRSVILFSIFCLNVDFIPALNDNETRRPNDCTSLAQESLFIFVTLNDFLRYNLHLFALPQRKKLMLKFPESNANEENIESCDCSDLEKKKERQREIDAHEYNHGLTIKARQYRAKINVNTSIGHVDFKSSYNKPPSQLHMYAVWNLFMEKQTTLRINYQIDLASFKSMYLATDNKMFNELNEIANILEHLRRRIDEKLAKECGKHGDKFFIKYNSLKSELGRKFMKYLKNLDDKKYVDPLWAHFSVLFTKMENKAKPGRQLPFGITAANYEHTSSLGSFKEDNMNENLSDKKTRTLTFNARIGDHDDGGVIDVKLE